jgi:hypothetical protein
MKATVLVLVLGCISACKKTDVTANESAAPATPKVVANGPAASATPKAAEAPQAKAPVAKLQEADCKQLCKRVVDCKLDEYVPTADACATDCGMAARNELRGAAHGPDAYACVNAATECTAAKACF